MTSRKDLDLKQKVQLHQFVTALQSKLIDVHLQADTSKQNPILVLFKAI